MSPFSFLYDPNSLHGKDLSAPAVAAKLFLKRFNKKAILYC